MIHIEANQAIHPNQMELGMGRPEESRTSHIADVLTNQRRLDRMNLGNEDPQILIQSEFAWSNISRLNPSFSKVILDLRRTLKKVDDNQIYLESEAYFDHDIEERIVDDSTRRAFGQVENQDLRAFLLDLLRTRLTEDDFEEESKDVIDAEEQHIYQQLRLAGVHNDISIGGTTLPKLQDFTAEHAMELVLLGQLGFGKYSWELNVVDATSEI